MYLDKKGPRKVSKQFPFSGQYSCGEMKTEMQPPPKILGNSDFLGSKRKFGQSQFSKTFPCFFYYSKETNIFYLKLKKS